MEDLAGQPDRPDRTVRAPVADAEPADLDGHRRGPSGVGAAGAACGVDRRACRIVGLGIGEPLLREVALAGEPRLVGGEGRREAQEADPDQRAEPDDLGQQHQEVVEHEERFDDDQAERDQPGPPQPLPHLEVGRVAVERPRPHVVEHGQDDQQDQRGDPGRVEDVREVVAVERHEEILPGGERHVPRPRVRVWMGRRSMPCQAVYSAATMRRRRDRPGPPARP